MVAQKVMTLLDDETKFEKSLLDDDDIHSKRQNVLIDHENLSQKKRLYQPSA